MKKFKEILFLKNLKRVGKATIYKKYWNLLNDCKDLDELVLKIESQSKFTKEDIDKAKNNALDIYESVINSDIQVITVLDENYPLKLMDMENKRPLILYAKGNLDALSKPNISVIGTRKPSDESKKFEKELVGNIVNNSDRVVVSGLALGCDKIAHQTTVDEGKITVAILPSGVNVIKPASNKKLAEQILETGGCLVSEYEPDTKVFRGNYVERDAIVAAFCDATFVVECGVKSGTMHTVNAAIDYNRQIFAYMSENRFKDSYGGNEFILNNNSKAIEVNDVDKFIKDLKKLNLKKSTKSIQTTF